LVSEVAARRRVGQPRDRRPYDAEALLDVAVRVFNERGYDGTSMDDVARAAGITKASIYYHVSGKEELLERGIRRGLDALFSMLDETGATNGPADARLRYVLVRTVEIMSDQLPEVALLLRVRGNTPVERWALEQRRAFTRHIAVLVQAAMDAGSLRSDLEAGLVARLLFGTVNSIVEWYRREGRLGPDDIAAAIETMVFDGLCAMRTAAGDAREMTPGPLEHRGP
jgi:AcrR family transcriptional regulator